MVHLARDPRFAHSVRSVSACSRQIGRFRPICLAITQSAWRANTLSSQSWGVLLPHVNTTEIKGVANSVRSVTCRHFLILGGVLEVKPDILTPGGFTANYVAVGCCGNHLELSRRIARRYVVAYAVCVDRRRMRFVLFH